MKYSMQYTRKILSMIGGSFYTLPCPLNLRAWWNFGSSIGALFLVQAVRGLVLACHYTAHELYAFGSVVHIVHDVNYGWFFRRLHRNGASVFFICIYCHIGRGIYYHSFFLKKVWCVGVIMYIILICIAFLGYVLPWGQMSYWGATVITNLFSAIPYIGLDITKWVWGGFRVCDATLKRFYILHLYLPFLLVGLFFLHIYYLHQVGSNNPLGVEDYGDLVTFHPYYRFKDFLGVVGVVGGLLMIVFFSPDLFRSPENFIPANPYKTPSHIEPEWYFLFAYTILRSVPRKSGGVMALGFSVVVLFFLVLRPKSFHLGSQFYPLSQLFFWLFVSRFLILTYIGMRPAESPYYELGYYAIVLYFRYFIFGWCLERFWDYFIVHLQYRRLGRRRGNWGVLGIWPFNLWYHGSAELR